MNTPTPKKTTSLTTRIAIAALVFVGAASLAGAAPLVQIPDIVTSGVGQNAFVSNVASDFDGTTSSQLVFDNGAVSTGHYFIVKFSETSLVNVGDKITFTYSVAYTNGSTGNQAFRLGLYDVGSATDSGFNNATGYAALYGSSSSTNNGLFERTGTSSSNLFGTADYSRFPGVNPTYTQAQFVLNPALNASGTVSFSGSFSLELVASNQVKITSILNGNTVLEAYTTDTTTPYTTFNAIGLYSAAPAGGGNRLVFSNFTVTMTAVPEPTGVTLLGLSAIFLYGVVGKRRRQRMARIEHSLTD